MLILGCDFLLSSFIFQAMTVIHNMDCQHREFQSRLDDAEKLRLYAQSVISKHQPLGASLAKVKSRSKHWEMEAKADRDKIARMEKERDKAKYEAKVARLETSTASDAKARAEEDRARVQKALAAAEEGRRKAEAWTARLEVEQTSLLLELGATNDEVSSLHSQEGKDKEAIEEEYQKALEVIFAYGYVCCVFKHNIYGDHLEVSDGMPDFVNLLPPEFFVNPWCPPI